MHWTGWVEKRWVMPLVGLVGVVAIAAPQRAMAHGASIEYRTTQALEVTATYDSGEPFAHAQVTVYAPDNPAEPWLTGTTDDQGRFTFTPDPAIAGNWDVQVRQAGHGDIVSIPLEGTDGTDDADDSDVALVSTTGSSSPSITPLQKAVMVGSVIWGLVGTALFFSSRSNASRSKNHAHS